MKVLTFANGRHDDQVDALCLIGQLLDTMVRLARPKPAVRPVRDRWDRLFEKQEWERGSATSWKRV